MGPQLPILKQWRLFVFFLAPLILLPLPLVVATQVAGAGYVILIVAIYSVASPIPLCMTAIMSVFLYPLLGIYPARQVAAWAINDPVMLMLGSIIFAMAIEGVLLHKRIALRVLLAVGQKPERLLMGFLFVSFILSMFIANIAVVVMLLPIVEAMKEEMDKFSEDSNGVVDHKAAEQLHAKEPPRRHQKLINGLFLASVYGSTTGGMTTLVGAHPNILFKLFIDRFYGDAAAVNFATFMAVTGPMAVCATILIWLSMTFAYAPEFFKSFWKKTESSHDDLKFRSRLRDLFQEQYNSLGSFNFGEGSVVTMFFILVALWLFREPQLFPGWGSLFKKGYVSDATPVLLISFLLFAWPSDWRLLWNEGVLKPVITWRPLMLQRFPWELLMYAIGTTVLAEGTTAAGLSVWIADLFGPLVVVPPWVLMILITVVVSILTEFLGNSLIAVMLIPVVASFAEKTMVNPIFYMLPIAMTTVLSFMTPMSAHTMMLLQKQGVPVREMCATGLSAKIICITLVVITMNTVADPVFDIHSFPAWAVNGTSGVKQ
ncbi:hypothetical protein RvY_15906 [Ramazzottius varieornatus]|uniref:Citrate transporter-like domain-containing protein n=1 Tax=Ramazzottius varieornatus TaxID=947166 RepID=A0A1D1VWJ9_RAMVA|nr:hypothetical protein RvY_15906 [Ramazzottius varieornatus]